MPLQSLLYISAIKIKAKNKQTENKTNKQKNPPTKQTKQNKTKQKTKKHLLLRKKSIDFKSQRLCSAKTKILETGNIQLNSLINLGYMRAAVKVMPLILLRWPHSIKSGCWWYGSRG